MRFLSNNPNFVGATTTLARVCERAETAANAEISVFLWGEPGVGKETLARAIAAYSERAEEPFVKIRCDRLAPKRLEALFPLRRNDERSPNAAQLPFNSPQNVVFNVDSPAVSDELARELGNGTLYLAEIDALSPRVGRRIAALLTSNELPFRTILGASIDFPKARREGFFSPELESILTAFPIFIPPFRERTADFPELATLFFREAAQKIGVLPRPLSEIELNTITNISFPNNLSDLRRYFEKIACADAPFSDAETESVPTASLEKTPNEPQNRRSPRENADADETLDRVPTPRENFPSLDAAAKAHIVAALRLTGGIVEGTSGAAALLKINPHTLRARMKKLELDWSKIRLEAEKETKKEGDAKFS